MFLELYLFLDCVNCGTIYLNFVCVGFMFNVIFTPLGKVSVEGKVEHKFDMKPHNENFEEYGRLCRERTNKSMIKNRQIQVRHALLLLTSFCYFLYALNFFWTFCEIRIVFNNLIH